MGGVGGDPSRRHQPVKVGASPGAVWARVDVFVDCQGPHANQVSKGVSVVGRTHMSHAQQLFSGQIHWRSLEGSASSAFLEVNNRGSVRFYKKSPTRTGIKLTVSYEIPEPLLVFANVRGTLLSVLVTMYLTRRWRPSWMVSCLQTCSAFGSMPLRSSLHLPSGQPAPPWWTLGWFLGLQPTFLISFEFVSPLQSAITS